MSGVDRCHLCGKPATHTGVVSDPGLPGSNLNESGYRRVPLCLLHALERNENHCARVEPIEESS